MLLVVLLSAAPTGAQPRTRLVGSAFDPASVSVVVRPKQSRVIPTAASQDKSKLPEDHGGSVPTLSLLAGLVLAIGFLALPAVRIQSAPNIALLLRTSRKAHPPRAPPAA